MFCITTVCYVLQLGLCKSIGDKGGNNGMLKLFKGLI